MAFPIGAALGAGASLIGSGLSFLGGSNAASFAAGQAGIQQQQFQQQLALAEAQMQFEREAATSGIQWRVADAKAAGISPLVALGAPTFNPGAIGVGGTSPVSMDNPYAGAGNALSGMGQDLSRAAMAAQTEKTRTDTLLQLEQMKNNSALTQSQVESNMADAALARKKAEVLSGSPAMPHAAGNFVDGQGNTPGLAVTKPSVGISPAAGQPSGEAAPTPAVKWTATAGGGLSPEPSLGTSVGATGENWQWAIRNRIRSEGPPASMTGGKPWHQSWDGVWYPGEGNFFTNIWWNPTKGAKGPLPPASAAFSGAY